MYRRSYSYSRPYAARHTYTRRAPASSSRGYYVPRAPPPPPVYTPRKAVIPKKTKAGPSTAQKVAKGIGQAAIGVGKMIPGPIGGIASMIGKITGLGDYKVKYNSIMEQVNPEAVTQPGVVPRVANSGSGRTVRIQHREYIQDVNSSINFANLSLQINPANELCFPWLSTMAQNFAEYRFHGLIFEFVSLSADALNSTNTALGCVVMTTNYNSAEPLFTSKSQAENAEFTVSSKPSCNLIHGIECDPSITVNQGHLYVSPNFNGTVPTGEDIKTYNLGNFQFITQGSQAVADIGELWVSYDIELIKPIISPNWALGRVDHWQLTNITATGSQLLGTTRTPKANGIGGVITTSTSPQQSVYTFPTNIEPGQVFRIDYFVYCSVPTSGVAVLPAISVNSVFTVNVPPLNLAAGALAAGGTTAYQMAFSTFVTVNQTYNGTVLGTVTFTQGSANLPNANPTGDFIITVYPVGYA